MNKSVVIFSGGLDSSVLLTDILKQGNEVVVLSFNYGQKNQIELKYARDFVWYMRGELEQGINYPKTIDLTSISPLISNSSLIGTRNVPTGDRDKESVIVPNRNMIMISIAAACAINLQYDEVVFANHKPGIFSMPDCREDFVQALAHAVWLCDDHDVRVCSPYQDMTKGEICKRGVEIGVPFHLTYSCYVGGEKPCGLCKACKERATAFEFAGISDPLLKEDEKCVE